MTRRLILCADDYGLAPGVGRGIRELVAAGRLSAVSCMTSMPGWDEESRLLRAVVNGNGIDVGLHLTLSDHPPLGTLPRLAPNGRLPPATQVIAWELLRGLPREEVRREVELQFDAFERAMGRPPTHVDGHHYLQAYPTVRRVLVEVLRTRYEPGRVYVRWCGDRLRTLLARRVATHQAVGLLAVSGGWRSVPRRHGIPLNASFSGLYSLTGRVPYGRLFERFILGAEEDHLVVCHPGHVDEPLRERDTFTEQRRREFDFLASRELPALLERTGFALGPFSAVGGRRRDDPRT